jgi:hypothetical protein
MIRLGSFGESIVAQAVNCAEFFNSIDPMQPFEFADANGTFGSQSGPIATVS